MSLLGPGRRALAACSSLGLAATEARWPRGVGLTEGAEEQRRNLLIGRVGDAEGRSGL
eukprot:CAMPEP_0180114140 /NCGR_PEP_ID=MMETSP0985-20121206/37142_1 /TAXON_ID=483367 /ORGANISM="non described non described, Strain CCMP 2436" /LENGTH=57 /DNA_ID=CAMNT_0022052661 /DNA_START=118 /DNA_END=287 /DNA_ORIENTATION=-